MIILARPEWYGRKGMKRSEINRLEREAAVFPGQNSEEEFK